MAGTDSLSYTQQHLLLSCTMFLNISYLDWISLGWLLLCWIGYAMFAKRQAKSVASLSSVLHVHRINWMRRLLNREVRVGDAALLASLERNVNFFANSCVLIVAGLLAALSATAEIQTVLDRISFADSISASALELKIATLIVIYVYAFFTFTGSMRQFGFAAVLMGAMPMPDEKDVTAQERRSAAIYSAKVIDQASHSYNYGLRAFYFSLAVVAWFIGPLWFVAAITIVIGILYEREFLSKSLKALKEVESVGDKLFEDDKELYQRTLLKTDKDGKAK